MEITANLCFIQAFLSVRNSFYHFIISLAAGRILNLLDLWASKAKLEYQIDWNYTAVARWNVQNVK